MKFLIEIEVVPHDKTTKAVTTLELKKLIAKHLVADLFLEERLGKHSIFKIDVFEDDVLAALEAYRKVAEPLVSRWRETKEWHGPHQGKPEFRDGEIHIDTGDLADFNKAEILAEKALKKGGG